MFETMFGSEMPLAARFFIAFLVVLVLIGLTAWLVRRFGANRLGGGGNRGRQPRLAVIDAASVDGRRRLVLIRRDNVEHLLMIGGPTDVVVEQNIVRASAAREPARVEPVVAAAPPARAVENSWPLQPTTEPAPVAPHRPYRSTAADESWHTPEPAARPRAPDSGSLTGLAAELSTRLSPPEGATPVSRTEAPVRPVPQAAPTMSAEPAPAQEDQNLADMAQQLEAALRRAPMPEGRPPVTDPLAAAAPRAFDKPVDAPPRAIGRDYKLRVDPQFDARPDPRMDARTEPKAELKAEPKFDPAPEPTAAAGKSAYDSLEEEMASLLGRHPGKS